jgi:hypothetical protein
MALPQLLGSRFTLQRSFFILPFPNQDGNAKAGERREDGAWNAAGAARFSRQRPLFRIPKQRDAPSSGDEASLFMGEEKLPYLDMRSKGTLRSLLDVKGNLVAFIEGFEARSIDSRMVHEHI